MEIGNETTFTCWLHQEYIANRKRKKLMTITVVSSAQQRDESFICQKKVPCDTWNESLQTLSKLFSSVKAHIQHQHTENIKREKEGNFLSHHIKNSDTS